MDRADASEASGREFESPRSHHSHRLSQPPGRVTAIRLYVTKRDSLRVQRRPSKTPARNTFDRPMAANRVAAAIHKDCGHSGLGRVYSNGSDEFKNRRGY